MAVIDELKDRMKFQVINLPLCFMPGYEQWNVGDVGKLDRSFLEDVGSNGGDAPFVCRAQNPRSGRMTRGHVGV